MTDILVPFQSVAGAYTTNLKEFSDSRGAFSETFRRSWFPWIDWTRTQMNRSKSKQGVLRGLHYHFHQVDYWLVMAGTLRVGLADLRPNSPTYKQTATLDVSPDDLQGVFIPIGVAHGFYALTDVTLLYVVNNYYNDGSDERGVAWNDETLNVNWRVDAPLLSERDQNNPNFPELESTGVLASLESIEIESKG